MKAVASGEEKAWIEQVSRPEPHGEWVLIKVYASPICGSDMHAFFADDVQRGGGHEGTGEVVQVDAAHRLQVGDRVLINPASGCGECPDCRIGNYIHCRHAPDAPGGHFAQYVLKQEWLCPKLPDDIDYDTGSLMGCALSPAYQALTRMELRAFHTVLITGLGPVGLGGVALATFMGAEVIASDPISWRRQLAEDLGAEYSIDPTERDVSGYVRSLTDGRGVQRALDASGDATAERTCIDALAPPGKVGFIGENQGNIEFSPSGDGIRRGIEIITAWHQNLNSFDNLVAFLRRYPHVDKLISHTYGFSEVQTAFETMASGECSKVILHPWEGQ